MSGLPHPFEPVTHITDWCDDGVATVRWCGKKYLFDDAITLEAGETKPCPVCGMELHHDEKKKGVVEFPKLSPTETGGQMNVREALEKLLAQDVYHCDDYDDDARLLAPIIEKALRAEHTAGVAAGYLLGSEGRYISDLVMKHALMGYEPTAGVAAMVEKGP